MARERQQGGGGRKEQGWGKEGLGGGGGKAASQGEQGLRDGREAVAWATRSVSQQAGVWLGVWLVWLHRAHSRAVKLRREGFYLATLKNH